MAKKRASFVGPVNPADPTTGILKPVGEQTAGQRRESENMSPRPIVKPKDVTTSKTFKEPVVKRQKPKVKTAENLKEAEIRTPKNSELAKKITSVSTVPKTRKRKVRGKSVARDPQTGRARAKTTAELTTVLPTAGRDVVEGAVPQTPRPLQRVSTIKDGLRGPKGAAVSHKEVSNMVSQARGHLTQMTLTRNTPAFHEHHESFNLAHAQLEKHAPAAHQILGIMRHLTVNPTPQSADHFELADKALGDTLSAYKAKDSHNKKSSRFAYAERVRGIKAERAGTSE